MDTAPDSNAPDTPTHHEQLIERLQPESDLEERLVRQMALCSVKLEYLIGLLAKAEERLRRVLASPQDEPSP